MELELHAPSPPTAAHKLQVGRISGFCSKKQMLNVRGEGGQMGESENVMQIVLDRLSQLKKKLLF